MSTKTVNPSSKDPFSLRVKIALLKRGLTMEDLANEIGQNRVTVSRAVNHEMFDPTRRRIAAFLKINP